MLQCALTMGQGYVNWLVFLCCYCLVSTLIRIKLGYAGMTILLFERRTRSRSKKAQEKIPKIIYRKRSRYYFSVPFFTENPTKKRTILTSIQTTRHQPLRKFNNKIDKRLSILTLSKNTFQESAIYYEKSLKNSGYKTKLQYQQPKVNNQNKKKRKSNIIWFNSFAASLWEPISGEYSSN